jgi:hypothetical protein
MIEAALRRKITLVPTIDEHILPACARAMSLHPDKVSFTDVCEFWSKHDSFRHFIRDRFKLRSFQELPALPLHVMLLDDMVFNEDFHWPDLNIHGSIKNIDDL